MSDVLQVVGFIAWVAAAWFIYVAFSMNVGVTMPADVAEMINAAAVANMHAMHLQLLNFLAGAFLSLNGSVLFVGGFLLGKGDPPPVLED